MLSPDQLEAAGNSVAAVYNDIEARMLDHLVGALLSVGRLDQATITELNLLAQSHTAQLRGYIEERAEQIDGEVRATAERLLRASDEDDLKRVGEGSPMWPQQVTATVDGVARILARDNLQMIEGAKQAFLGASIEAVTRVNTGTMTTERALHSAVRKLEREGIPIITYRNAETGTVTVENKVDVAVRRHIRTQIAQDGARMTLERIEASDVTLVEVSSHEDSRPSHAEWQGRCYSLRGEQVIDGTRYPDFYEATRYGQVDGLLGANCRHSFGPYRHGTARAYEPDPKHPSGLSGAEVYEYEQTQRHLERQIREAKRELRGAQLVYDKTAGLESRSALAKAQERLREKQAAMRGLIAEANGKAKPGTHVLTRRPNREWAGDMPKTARLGSTGMKLDQFIEANAAKIERSGASKSAVRAAMARDLRWSGVATRDFGTLSKQQADALLQYAIPGATPASGGRRVFREIEGDHSREDDLSATNPGFSRRDYAHMNNCQRCVPAYEMRRRGMDVVAKPRPEGDDKLAYSWDRIFVGQRWHDCGSSTTGRGQIEQRLMRWGDGARAEVMVEWADGGTHVFVAENIGGNVVFSDPQSGNADASRYFQDAVPGATLVSRIDNLKPSILIDDCCTSRKE